MIREHSEEARRASEGIGRVLNSYPTDTLADPKRDREWHERIEAWVKAGCFAVTELLAGPLRAVIEDRAMYVPRQLAEGGEAARVLGEAGIILPDGATTDGIELGSFFLRPEDEYARDLWRRDPLAERVLHSVPDGITVSPIALEAREVVERLLVHDAEALRVPAVSFLAMLHFVMSVSDEHVVERWGAQGCDKLVWRTILLNDQPGATCRRTKEALEDLAGLLGVGSTEPTNQTLQATNSQKRMTWHEARKWGESYVKTHPFVGLNALAALCGALNDATCSPHTMRKAVANSDYLTKAEAAHKLQKAKPAKPDQTEDPQRKALADETLRILMECALESERASLNTPEMKKHLEDMEPDALAALVEQAQAQAASRKRAAANARTCAHTPK